MKKSLIILLILRTIIIHSQPTQVIPVIECNNDININLNNGRVLKFICDEKNLDVNKRIKAITLNNNYYLQIVKNYNSSYYDLIWEDDFNDAIINEKNWRGDLPYHYHYGLLNKDNVTVIQNPKGPTSLEYGAGFNELPNLFNSSNGTIKLITAYNPQWRNVFDYHENGCNTATPLNTCILKDGVQNYRRFKYETARLESIQNFKHGNL
ncbi:MAG: hypothetical protein ACK4IK_05760 [Bacteroidia bacterium]